MDAQGNEKEERFILLYKTYIDEVYQFIFMRTGFRSAVAEDISQDIFLDVFRGLNQFRGLCSERTWVFRIARNKLNDYYRKQYGQKFDTCDIDHADQISDPLQNLDLKIVKSIENQEIRQCLNKLETHYRMILLMKYVDKRSVKEIAKTIDKTPKAIESMLQRAKGAFMKEYKAMKEKEERFYE